MKKLFKRDIFFFILGVLVTITSTVFAYSYLAGQIGFIPSAEDWNVDNVQDALDSFRDIASHCPFGCQYELGEAVYAVGSINGEDVFVPECSGNYKLEVWGAQGGSAHSNYVGGYGGYSVGVVRLNANETIYINVGGQGSGDFTHTYKSGGYNGGGDGLLNSDGNTRPASGGGATSIALVSGELKNLESYKGTLANSSSENDDDKYYVSNNILIVAGGGGGSAVNAVYVNGYYSTYDVGHAGGFKGKTSRYVSNFSDGVHDRTSSGGTQIAGGTVPYSPADATAPSFGQGGSVINSGGGGGFFGGAYNDSPSAGGSGYIASSKLISYSDITKAMYCYECEENTGNNINTISTHGASTRTSERNASECLNGYSSSPVSKCAKAGDGYAKITYLGV